MTDRISGPRRSSRATSSADAGSQCATTHSRSGSRDRPRENTTIALVATDAALTKPQAKRLAVMAHDGLARAIYPAHTPLDGDIVFAASTQQRPLGNPVHGLAELGTVAANVLARAIARAVYEATALPFPNALPSWKDKFGRSAIPESGRRFSEQNATQKRVTSTHDRPDARFLWTR